MNYTDEQINQITHEAWENARKWAHVSMRPGRWDTLDPHWRDHAIDGPTGRVRRLLSGDVETDMAEMDEWQDPYAAKAFIDTVRSYRTAARRRARIVATRYLANLPYRTTITCPHCQRSGVHQGRVCPNCGLFVFVLDKHEVPCPICGRPVPYGGVCRWCSFPLAAGAEHKRRRRGGKRKRGRKRWTK